MKFQFLTKRGRKLQTWTQFVVLDAQKNYILDSIFPVSINMLVALYAISADIKSKAL